MAPVRSTKASSGSRTGGSLSQSTLNFRRTKSNSGPSSSLKGAKVTQPGTPTIKGSSLKNVIRLSDDSSSSSSSDEDEAEVPPSISSPVRQKGKQQQQPKADPEKPREELNVRKYGKLYGLARNQANGLNFIHSTDKTQVHHILRTFDLSYQYGPCIGMTRLERWSRAETMGLNPPKEIKEILESKQGMEEDSYKECVFFEEV